MPATGGLAVYLLVRHLPGCGCHAASSAIPILMEAAIATLSQACHGSNGPLSAPLLIDKIIFEERRCQRDKPFLEVNSEIYHIKSRQRSDGGCGIIAFSQTPMKHRNCC
jgi:hypothetical protein